MPGPPTPVSYTHLDVYKRQLLLDRGTRLNESAIALAASVGKSQLKVFVRPRVAVLTTGDEIVEVDAEPGPTQIHNSNSYSLAAQIQKAGGEPVLLPIAPDEPRRLRELIEAGLQSDLLIMTGGVSMGPVSYTHLCRLTGYYCCCSYCPCRSPRVRATERERKDLWQGNPVSRYA